MSRDIVGTINHLSQDSSENYRVPISGLFLLPHRQQQPAL